MPAAATFSPDVQPSADGQDAELLEIIRTMPRHSDERKAACQALVERYGWLVSACVHRYRASSEFREDLMQVGYVGLLTAINHFDPATGSSLTAYARPCISGEIKRHFRDKHWPVHVKRPVQELRLHMRDAAAELTQQLNRAPDDPELARFLDVSDQELRDAHLADAAFQMRSLDAPLAGDDGTTASLADLLGAEDPGLDQILDIEAVRTHWPELPGPQQRVLLLRYYGNMTQADIAGQLRISQMQVSRLQARALQYLHTAILGA
jgi:RNA polymerase sigma-B factor